MDEAIACSSGSTFPWRTSRSVVAIFTFLWWFVRLRPPAAMSRRRTPMSLSVEGARGLGAEEGTLEEDPASAPVPATRLWPASTEPASRCDVPSTVVPETSSAEGRPSPRCEITRARQLNFEGTGDPSPLAGWTSTPGESGYPCRHPDSREDDLRFPLQDTLEAIAGMAGWRGRRPNGPATETSRIVGVRSGRAQQSAARPLAHSSMSTRTFPSFSSRENPVVSPWRRKTTEMVDRPTRRLWSSTMLSHGGSSGWLMVTWFSGARAEMPSMACRSRNGAPAAHACGAQATG